MNWSMMVCAPLAKSPNCASHSTSVRGIGERIAIFEAEHAEFAERGVPHLETAGPDGRQRDIFVAGFLVDPHGVALAEGAAAAILPRQADAVALARSGCRTPAPRRSPSRNPRRCRTSLVLASRMRCSVLWMCRPSGTVVSTLPSLRSSSSPIAVAMLRRPSTGSSGRPEPRPAALEPVRLVGQIADRRPGIRSSR